MRRLLLVLSVGLSAGAAAQQPMSMPGMQPTPAAKQRETPELLREVPARAPMRPEDFLALALQHPALAAGSAQVSATEAEARQAGMAPSPRVGYSGEHIRGGAYGGGEQGGFAEQQFVLGGKLGLRRDALRREAAAGAAGVDELRLSVRGEVSRAFYAALAAQAGVAVRQAQLALALEGEDTARQQANLGQNDSPGVLGSEIDAGTAEIEYVRAQREYLARWAALVAAAGLPSRPAAPLAGELASPPALDTAAETARIISASPSLKRARLELAAAEARLRAQGHEAIPDLTVKAGEWWSGEQLNTGRAAGPMSFAEASIPLPLWNRNQGAVDAARAEVAHAQAEVAALEAELRGVAEPLAEAYEQARWEAARYRDELLPRAERAVSLTTANYNNMQAAYGPVLSARRTSLALQLSYVGALEREWSSALTLQNFTGQAAAGAHPMLMDDTGE